MFRKYLQDHQKKILREWFRAIVETYPKETAAFLLREKDPFDNPVGSSIQEGMAGIYRALLGEISEDEASPFLDRIIRVRAVQEFKPSEAMAFIFALKDVVRRGVEEVGIHGDVVQDLRSFEDRVDRLALASFNIYMQCREQLYELRVQEVKNRTARLLERANAIWESKDREDSLEDS